MGYSVLFDQVNNKKIPFQCFKLKGRFKKKNTLSKTAHYNPVTSEEILLKIIESCKQSIELKDELKANEEITSKKCKDKRTEKEQIKNK